MCALEWVVVVGGGVAGLSASTFTARAGLETLVLDSGESVPRRNAHLENFPGFPAGVNARLLLDTLGGQTETAGADRETATVTAVETDGNGFTVETATAITPSTWSPRRRTRPATSTGSPDCVRLLEGLPLPVDGVGVIDRGKAFVDVDERGRTGVDGLYATGRLAEKPYRAIVCASHGAEVAVTLLEDDDRPFYYDWVAPDGYFPTATATSRPAARRPTKKKATAESASRSTRCRSTSPVPTPRSRSRTRACRTGTSERAHQVIIDTDYCR